LLFISATVVIFDVFCVVVVVVAATAAVAAGSAVNDDVKYRGGFSGLPSTGLQF